MLQDAFRTAAARHKAARSLAVNDESVTAVSLADPLLRVAVQAPCVDGMAASLFQQPV
jgi:hypothetical protein